MSLGFPVTRTGTKGPTTIKSTLHFPKIPRSLRHLSPGDGGKTFNLSCASLVPVGQVGVPAFAVSRRRGGSTGRLKLGREDDG